jgi:hypothetical protein
MSAKAMVAKGLLTSLFSALKRIKTRTWVMLGAAFFLLLAFMVWAAFSLLAWMWGGTQNVLQSAGINSQSIQQATQQVSTKAQDYMQLAKEKLATAPTLEDLSAKAQQKTASVLAEAVPPDAEKALAVGAALAGVTLASGIDGNELREVSGDDVGPSRFPGLTRTSFQRNSDGTNVQYQGKVDFNAVLAHYQQAFSTQGFKQEVLSADVQQETHRFTKAAQSFTLSLAREPAALVKLTLREKAQ